MFTEYVALIFNKESVCLDMNCTGRKEILDGMLGANLVCFQVSQ